jgi:hypothetical protein
MVDGRVDRKRVGGDAWKLRRGEASRNRCRRLSGEVGVVAANGRRVFDRQMGHPFGENLLADCVEFRPGLVAAAYCAAGSVVLPAKFVGHVAEVDNYAVHANALDYVISSLLLIGNVLM